MISTFNIYAVDVWMCPNEILGLASAWPTRSQ